MEEGHTRYSKRLRTGTRRRYQDDGISDDEIEGKRTFNLNEKLHCDKYNSDLVKRMEGKDFTFEYIQREGLRDPIIFEKADGLGIQMPDSDFSVNDVKLFVGSRRVIDVMDVTTQKGIEMSMAQWRRYYETPASQRGKLYNVISLEFSHTKLENLVKRPASVDVVDWVDNMWPRHLKERQRDSTNAIIEMQYPKVQKYCLMSVEGCFTDFHIDFGGTSVWYHILRGGKIFWLIPPTSQNLELYENWVLSGKQGDIFLGDKASHCQRVELKQGYTFMIPSGWIHAVYTPMDTLVFGGNFLHSFNIPMQLHIYNIEDRTRVPPKFRYPFYYEMCWYVLERYLYCLTNISHLTPEFQKYSLGIGLTREDVSSPEQNVNGHAKEEEEEEQVSPPMKPGVKVHLTPLELEGLWNLLGKLESLPSHKKCVPAGIHNAPALLHDIRAVLEEHANDDPKLAYTGKPIVKWPERPPWYQPPPLPPSILNRPHLSSLPQGPPPPPRPVKPPSSISAIRRRRVRCKRCEACLRTECGDCNFCRDMRKFGGPGRLKQTCVLRQCLAPGLPLSAVCSICGESGQDPGETTDLSTTLMECSNCAQITHPECIKAQGEGVVNKELPSCWECPKCVLEKKNNSESSGSDDDDDEEEDDDTSVTSPGPRPPASPTSGKTSHGEGLGKEDDCGGRPTRRGRPSLALSYLSPSRGRRMVPPPSQRLLLQQQQQNRKRAAALELRLRRKIKLERDKILQTKRRPSSLDSRSPKVLRSCSQGVDDDGHAAHRRLRGSSRLSPDVRLLRGGGASRRGLWRGSPYRMSRGGRPTVGSPLMRRELGIRRDRGRGVRRRGMGQHQRPREDMEERNEEDNSKGEGADNQRGGLLDKENRPQGLGADDDKIVEMDQDGTEEEKMDEDGEEGSQLDSDPSSQLLLVSDLNDDLLKSSRLTVTLQRPPKAKRDPGAIVPKLEAAVSTRASNGQGYVQRKSLQRPRLNNGNAASERGRISSRSGSSGRHPHVHLRRSSLSLLGQRKGLSLEARATPPQAQAASDSASPSTSSSEALASPVSPPSILSTVKDSGHEPGCEKEVWVSVFRYLTRAELCVCMTVCKSWYKWSCDKRLWTRIDLSWCKAISPQALSGIIKRQPVSLNLSGTLISKKQLTWLINRLPGLKDLMVSGCTWPAVSALSSPSCPPLRSLDLRWIEGVKDTQIRDLLNPPGCNNRSKLRNLLSFRLSGLEISDSTLRLIIRHMPLLTQLDLSHCRGITDQSVNLLSAVGSSTRNTLTEINLAGCSKLTDTCLQYLKRFSSVTLLDLRDCRGVTRKACENFISELSVNTLYCLSEDKLIQRIS
ncbi:lysine-specific demethylase 2A isoform X1 [Paramormyrops kingsleyae]|uniref:lysine-specific demethylase 2A isoform X1 n=2 Tax=Paramormyrops kingsleyae TaxID=1676925 RepID=UPI000CD65A4A|nr:lysine-specific demethylase 2A-like isoform X1 [Paramormyrops kingsleyae]